MLRKLMKYDNRSLRKALLPIYGISVIAATAVGLTQWLLTYLHSESLEIPFIITLAMQMLSSFSSLLIGAASFGTVLVLAYRYHRSINTDEGYLTFTLPVKQKTIVWSKLFSGILWMLAGIGVTVVNIFIILLFDMLQSQSEGYFITDTFKVLGEGLKHIFSKAEYIMQLASVLALGLAWVIWYLCIIYLSLSIGGVIAQKHKGAAGIGVYFILNFLSGIVFIFIMIFSSVLTVETDWASIEIWLGICTLCMLLLSYLLIVINRNLLKKRLNLQ